MLIQGVGRGDFLGVLDVKNRGGIWGGGVYGVKNSKYIGNISMRKENLNF